MISIEALRGANIWSILLFAVAVIALSVAFMQLTFRLLIRRRTGKRAAQIIANEVRSLADPDIRKRLGEMLTEQKITGCAQIVEGRVIPELTEAQLHPLALVLGRAALRISRLRNPAACSLYIRDSENDRWIVLDELDLDDIREAARIVQSVAEEKR